MLCRRCSGCTAVAHSVHVYCEDHRAAAETRRGQSRLNSRVSRADHGNIVFSCIIAHNLTSFPIYSEIQFISKIKYNNFDILFSHAELFKYLIDHRIRNTLASQFIQSCNGTLQRDRHRVPRHAHKQSVFRFLQRRERLLYVRALALRIENAVVRVQLSGFQCRARPRFAAQAVPRRKAPRSSRSL